MGRNTAVTGAVVILVVGLGWLGSQLGFGVGKGGGAGLGTGPGEGKNKTAQVQQTNPIQDGKLTVTIVKDHYEVGKKTMSLDDIISLAKKNKVEKINIYWDKQTQSKAYNDIEQRLTDGKLDFKFYDLDKSK